MFRCYKTGASAQLEDGTYLHGDMYRDEQGNLLYRVCYKGELPARPVIHFIIYSWDQWWDEDDTSESHNSTMLLSDGQFVDCGYEGAPIKEKVS